jgi:hypothetical protein
MLRPSRALTVWLLWLAIALLPIRAWAFAAMPVEMVAGAAVVTVASDLSLTHNDGAGPCHQGNDEGGVGENHSCGLCGVCHSAVVALPSLMPTPPSLPSARPAIAPAPGVERPVLAGPDRPPRIVPA